MWVFNSVTVPGINVADRSQPYGPDTRDANTPLRGGRTFYEVRFGMSGRHIPGTIYRGRSETGGSRKAAGQAGLRTARLVCGSLQPFRFHTVTVPGTVTVGSFQYPYDQYESLFKYTA